jgi:hypothetical protein
MNGARLVRFEVYIEDGSSRHYIAAFELLHVMKEGRMTLHTQQLGVKEGAWLGKMRVYTREDHRMLDCLLSAAYVGQTQPSE